MRVLLIAWYLLQPEHLTRWAKFQVCGWSRDTICQRYKLQQRNTEIGFRSATRRMCSFFLWIPRFRVPYLLPMPIPFLKILSFQHFTNAFELPHCDFPIPSFPVAVNPLCCFVQIYSHNSVIILIKGRFERIMWQKNYAGSSFVPVTVFIVKNCVSEHEG